jgi:hypothetical protein
LGSAGLVRLCKATGRASLIEQALGVFELTSESWAGRPLAEPAWSSDLTDDATPYEFSLGFEQGRPDVRMLVEAQGARPTAHEQWKAGSALSSALADQYGASCTELLRLADLFEPSARSSLLFGLWHGVTFKSGQVAPDFKAYLNPLVCGRDDAFRVVNEALMRLGLNDSAAFIAEAERACGGRAWPVYFCLDLARDETSRAKVYLAHDEPENRDAKFLLSRCSNLQPTDVDDWCRAIVGAQVRFTERPLLSCFSFTQRDQRPCGTLHIPARCYVKSDKVLFDRILGLLDDVSGEMYKATVRALIARPLDAACGFQTYVSLRRSKGTPRMTVYLAPEAYATTDRESAVRGSALSV